MSSLKKSNIYSVSMDETPYGGHVDQLTLIFHYMEKDMPVERFLKLLLNQAHKAQDMFKGLLHFSHENKIDIKDYRGQSYDNASPMSEKYNGFQALVVQENSLAIWVPCIWHSVHLTGEKVSDASVSSTHYFIFLQGIYMFFSGFNARWTFLMNKLKIHQEKDARILVPQKVECTR